MRKLFTPWFIICCFFWCVIHFFRAAHCPIPFFNSYLTDFLFIPVVAHVCLWFTRLFIVQNDNYYYPSWYYLFIALYASIVFEFIMPDFSVHFVRDYGDIVAYFTGALFNIVAASKKCKWMKS